ncbi:gas vesicle protein GvpO [Thermoactinospora rubra]|uniref:gas vesicle protein GvpO n=1 Tax=Thermoactinospora rubra TaxID=1088767 RepID=UPI000A10AD4B|nr:gas vesicle protein GvpO [Thermoactinospora rubra]
MPARRRIREGEAEAPPRRAAREEEAPPPRRARPALTAATAGAEALRQIAELTSRQTEGVTLVEPQEEGWLVGVEVVEDRRIPSSGDVLAIYEAELDSEGNLMAYRRVRRYRRGSDVGEQR